MVQALYEEVLNSERGTPNQQGVTILSGAKHTLSDKAASEDTLSLSVCLWCSDRRWWINRPAISKPPSGRFFILRRFRQVFSCQSEPPSELFCWFLHPSPRDMKQHPIWLRCLSSRNGRQGAREDLARRPFSMGSVGGHGWRPLSVALRQTFASSLTRLHEPHPQRFVRTDKMVVRPPPLQVSQEVRRLLGRGPGAACQR